MILFIDSSCELMFHPGDARSKGVILEEGKDIVSALASNLREQALPELAKVIYNEEEFRSIALPNLRPMDGSDWTQEQKEKFHNDIFRYRRDLRAVSKSLGIPLKICQAYYLGTYKTTWEYRLLKSVCIDEREGRAMATDHGPDACSICGGDGSLLICDGCDGEFHMACLRPPLRVVPEGHWLCDDCVDRRVIETRNSFIRNSKLFEKIEGKGTKRTWDGDECTSKEKDADNIMSDLDISSVAVYRPVPAFLEAAREFSMKISKILAKTEDD